MIKNLDFNLSNYLNSLISDPKKWKKLLWFALIARLLLFITDGHNSDFDFFEFWADRIVQYGFTNIYAVQVDRFECDYPPLYLYVIGFFGHLFNFFHWPIHTHFFDSFLKAFNLLVEFVFLFQFYKLTKNKIFIAFMLISPVSILNAYGWGQVDIIYSILVFSSIYFILSNRLYLAAILLGLSLAFKTQTILFLPIIGLLFLINKSNIQTKLFSFLLLAIVYLIPNLPFILFAANPMDSINPHFTAAGRYNFIAVNSFNIYWALWADFGLKLKLKFPPNDVLVFGLISRKILAYSLFAIIYTSCLIFIMKFKQRKQVIAILAFFCFSFFMFLPEMHERYLFPFFIFSAFMCSENPKEIKYYILISILHCMNLFWGWGEQKFIKIQWPFELTRIIAFATFVTWCFYAKHIYQLLFKKEEINTNQ